MPQPLFPSLVELLRARAAEPSAAPAYRLVERGDDVRERLTYAQLHARARAIAARLRETCRAGDRVLLLYPPGLAYIEAFFGCLYAGVIGVPAYPPDPTNLDRTLPRLLSVVGDAGPSAILTLSLFKAMSQGLEGAAPALASLPWIASDAIATEDGLAWEPPAIGRDTIAFLQYTSGSTGDPKGVMVSHGNLLENLELQHRGFGTDSDLRFVSWLPIYHDMGLVGKVLQPLYMGGQLVLMSPVDFLRSPVTWLRAISTFSGTLSGAPNFAYDLCVRKVSIEDRATLDLSSWKLAFNAAEPIRAETMDRF
ncbi:MAG: AMP-binding protein, partial [Planctomycetota bacterium]